MVSRSRTSVNWCGERERVSAGPVVRGKGPPAEELAWSGEFGDSGLARSAGAKLEELRPAGRRHRQNAALLAISTAIGLWVGDWAVEDPGRGADWVAPRPVGEQEINGTKANRQRKSRMDARTRERLPVLPVVVRVRSQTVQLRLKPA